MTDIEITSILGLMGLGISLFFMLYIAIIYKKHQSETLLFLLFAVLSLNLTYSLLIDTKIIEFFPYLYLILNKGFVLHVLIYPLLLAFIQTYTRSTFRKILFLTFMLPFAWLLVESVLRFVTTEPEIVQQLVTLFLEDKRPGPDHIFGSPYLILFTILIPSLVLLQIFKELRFFLKDGVLSQTKNLLVIFSTLATLIFILRLSNYPIQQYFYQFLSISFIEWKVEIIFNLLFILILSISTLLHFKLEDLGEIELRGQLIKASSITDIDLKNLLQDIKNVVVDNKLFLNHSLTIDQLSQELNVNTKYLSIALNRGMGKSFPEFVNGYRMEKAKELILSDKIKEYSIDAIAEESGFNSRATFYRIFKEETGTSPLAFRKENLKL